MDPLVKSWKPKAPPAATTLKDCKSHDPDVATKSTLNIIQGSSKLAESDPQTYFFFNWYTSEDRLSQCPVPLLVHTCLVNTTPSSEPKMGPIEWARQIVVLVTFSTKTVGIAYHWVIQKSDT